MSRASVSKLHVCLAQWHGVRKCVVVTSAWWALPIGQACCLTGSPWACLSLQPTRPLLFPAQCYVLLSKYVREKKMRLYICLSVGLFHPLQGCRVLGFGLRAVFTQSLSITMILKAQCIVVALCWICMMVYSFNMIKRFYGPSEQIPVLERWWWCSVNSMEPF